VRISNVENHLELVHLDFFDIREANNPLESEGMWEVNSTGHLGKETGRKEGTEEKE